MILKKYYRKFRSFQHKALYNPTFVGLLVNIFSPTYWIVYRSWARLNLFKILWINFHYLPVSQAKKLPIFIYGKCKFLRACGSIEIDTGNIATGMICINKSTTSPCNAGAPTEVLLTQGKIVFKGRAYIHSGCRIIVNNGGTLTIGDEVYINNQNNIACFNSITIGDYTQIGHQNQIFDTNFHHIIDMETNRVLCSNAPIVLGDHTWCGNRVTILHGVKLAPYTIVSSNSLVTKCVEEPYSIIGGIPAKLLKTGRMRLYDVKLEAELHPYFSNGGGYYQL